MHQVWRGPAVQVTRFIHKKVSFSLHNRRSRFDRRVAEQALEPRTRAHAKNFIANAGAHLANDHTAAALRLLEAAY